MKKFSAASAFFLLALAACHTVESRRIQFPEDPVAVKMVNRVIDEERLEYGVRFRNTGNQVVTFDYTISDEPGVPHIDADGPNSGLVENLYPGAEVEFKNPFNRMAVFVTLGRVTPGHLDASKIREIYRPNAPTPGGADDLLGLGGGDLLLP